jgi:hypothetical protein
LPILNIADCRLEEGLKWSFKMIFKSFSITGSKIRTSSNVASVRFFRGSFFVRQRLDPRIHTNRTKSI